MTDNCPECGGDLVELYASKLHPGTYTYSSYPIYECYGYWCRICEKLYVKKHKEWLEPWTHVTV